MNGFLVLARCGMDDVPLRLFEEEADALDFALVQTHQSIARIALLSLSLDVSVFIGVDIIEFREGEPCLARSAVEFEESAQTPP